MLTAAPAPLLFASAVVESDPDAVVLPPKTVERRHDELVRLQIVDLRQFTAVLPQHPTTARCSYGRQFRTVSDITDFENKLKTHLLKLVHGQVTINFVASVSWLSVCLCRVFLSRL